MEECNADFVLMSVLGLFYPQVSCFVSNAEEIGACEPLIVLRTQLHILVHNYAFCQLQMCMYLMIVWTCMLFASPVNEINMLNQNNLLNFDSWKNWSL